MAQKNNVQNKKAISRKALQQKKKYSKKAAMKTHCLGMNYYVNFLGGIDSNGFHIK
jgi:hypothetical protein